MTISSQTLARRRRRNPIRDARRQAEITRMRNRILDYVPMYRDIRDIRDARGQIVGAVYLGHVAVTAR